MVVISSNLAMSVFSTSDFFNQMCYWYQKLEISRERIPSDWIGRSVTANDRRERIREQILSGVDFSCDLSEPIRGSEIRSRENPLPRKSAPICHVICLIGSNHLAKLS